MPQGAGGGRPKKDGATRHRNKPMRDTIFVDPDARAAVVPDPVIPISTASGRSLWDYLWSLPIASLWDPADSPAITRMVRLQSLRSSVVDAKILAEIRQLEDRFLLNPYARAQQRVVIGRPETPGDGEDAGVTELDGYRARAQRGQ